MDKKLLGGVLIIIAFAAAFFFLSDRTVYDSYAPVTNFEECVAAGNPVMESYPRRCQHEGAMYTEKIGGGVGESCTVATDCQLPMEYAIQSNCPYEASCRNGTCAVVCPSWEHTPLQGQDISYNVSCTAHSDCNCDSWDNDGTYPCECVNGRCASVVEAYGQ